MKKLSLAAVLLAPLVHAEIVLPAGAGEAALYAYEHPALRSLVFVSPASRQMAILPPMPVFLAPPPLLMRAPTSMPPYPPTVPQGFNQPARPGNRDDLNYNLQRAHGFSQNLYRENALWPYFGSSVYYSWPAWGPTYAPAQPPAFNQPARPGNRDNNTYLLERAHRFSMDGYRRQ